MAMAGLFSQSQLPALPSHKCFSSLLPASNSLGSGLRHNLSPDFLTPSVLHQSWEVRCHEACHVTIIQSLTQNIRYYQSVRLFWNANQSISKRWKYFSSSTAKVLVSCSDNHFKTRGLSRNHYPVTHTEYPILSVCQAISAINEYQREGN